MDQCPQATRYPDRNQRRHGLHHDWPMPLCHVRAQHDPRRSSGYANSYILRPAFGRVNQQVPEGRSVLPRQIRRFPMKAITSPRRLPAVGQGQTAVRWLQTASSTHGVVGRDHQCNCSRLLRGEKLAIPDKLSSDCLGQMQIGHRVCGARRSDTVNFNPTDNPRQPEPSAIHDKVTLQ